MSDDGQVKRIDSPTLVISPDDAAQRILVRKCKLLVVSGPLQGREFVMNKPAFTIGSGPHCDLCVEDSTVSRHHCEILLIPEGYAVRDLGSTNGTVVQGVRVSEAFLDQGTEFQLGKTKIIFCPLQETTEYRLSSNDAFGQVLGKSVPMRRVFYLAERYAPTEATVLIEGETGTGKEILAEEIHHHSSRSGKPFIVIDCGALSKELIESELFGHTKGAFTGANTERVGAFEHADGGTVFLDEIGDLSLDLQPKLLRVLEKREIRRLGSNQVRAVNVRIVAATNRRLRNEVNASRFREDLYFRFSVVRIELPPLRMREEDIPMLTRRFLGEFHGPETESRLVNFDETMDAFARHDWPGNVRELRNLVEIASYGQQDTIDLGAYLCLERLASREQGNAQRRHTADRPFKEAKQQLIQEFEQQYIKDILRRHDGNISRAAREAGIERAYLQRLIRKYGSPAPS